MKKIICLVFVVFLSLFLVNSNALAGCGNVDQPDCPESVAQNASGSIFNEVTRQTGGSENGAYQNGFGSLYLESQGSKFAEICGEIKAEALGDASEFASHAKTNIAIEGKTKQYKDGYGAIEASGFAEQGTIITGENYQNSELANYGCAVQKSDASLNDFKEKYGRRLEYSGELNAEGAASIDFVSTDNHRRTEINSSSFADGESNGASPQIQASAGNAYVGGVNLGSAWAEFSGNGNDMGASAQTSGTGYADIQQSFGAHSKAISAKVYSRQKAGSN